jgi:uncharacterized OB-fold protein
VVPAVQRRSNERRALAAQRHPGGQGFAPGAPYAGPTGNDFVPFGVGLVQLGLGEDAVIRVEGRLTENDPAKLQFGQEVELTMLPFTTDADGNEIITFAFQPV